ncbi:MAG: class I SAM-dependent methyltransferase [Micrococcus sp.]|nr:class I SAM-dependent methyltransferase [Micrococcus sp.]
MDNTQVNPETFWDERYGESDAIWSGNVNVALADVVVERELEVGTALDLGCGEGADALWLAQHGWRTTGLDISVVAVQRARAAAKAQGFSETQARFEAADLMSWNSDQKFDLITASFLQSPVQFDRAQALHVAQDLVAPGGRLLVISHASFPPWAKDHHEDADHEAKHETTTPESELELLQLDERRWSVEIAELRSREITAPDGKLASLDDTVILARRTGWD